MSNFKFLFATSEGLSVIINSIGSWLYDGARAGDTLRLLGFLVFAPLAILFGRFQS